MMKSSTRVRETTASIGGGATGGALAHLTKQQKLRIETEARPLVTAGSRSRRSSKLAKSAGSSGTR